MLFIMSDEDIIKYFIKDNKIIPNRTNIKHLTKSVPEFKKYLDTRFFDSESYVETITRIFYKIEEKPKCHKCDKILHFLNFNKPFGKWCSSKCQLSDDDFIKERNKKQQNKSQYEKEQIQIKRKNTCLKKYGDKNYNNRQKAENTYFEKYNSKCPLSGEKRKEWSDKIFEKTGKYTITDAEKIAKTKLERYGDEGYVNKEKRLQTMKEKYGVEYTLQSTQLRNKTKHTKLEKYGNENYTNPEKAKQTCLIKYGVDNPFKIQEIRTRIDYDKVVDTKIKTGTINSSKQEKALYDILCDIYGTENIIQEYKDYRYKNPKTNRRWCCDFYIKNLDIFIELQGHYTHGTHPFDENSENDIQLKNQILEKVSESKPTYKKILEIWCETDVLKRTTAKENNLKYIEIFDLNFTKESITNIVNKILEE